MSPVNPSPYSTFAAAAGEASAAAIKAAQTTLAMNHVRREWPMPSSDAAVRLCVMGAAAFIHVPEYNLTPYSARKLIAILCEIIGDPRPPQRPAKGPSNDG